MELEEFLKLLQESCQIDSDNGTITIKIISNNNGVEDEIKNFTDYLNNLEDEVFISVCEFMGNENIHRIQKCLDSKNLESVRAAIIKFKKAVSDCAKDKVKFWESYV